MGILSGIPAIVSPIVSARLRTVIGFRGLFHYRFPFEHSAQYRKQVQISVFPLLCWEKNAPHSGLRHSNRRFFFALPFELVHFQNPDFFEQLPHFVHGGYLFLRSFVLIVNRVWTCLHFSHRYCCSGPAFCLLNPILKIRFELHFRHIGIP